VNAITAQDTMLDEQPAPPSRRHPGRWLASAGVAVIVAAAAVAATVTHPFGTAHPAPPADNGAATSLATVARRTITAQAQVSGTLGYAGSYSIINKASGTYTSLPGAGSVIRQGDVLYRVNGAPVVLLYGTTPAYRALAEGATAADVAGPDVRQLNAALIALGYASRDELDPASDEFSWRTKAAVEKLQAQLGVSQTGQLALGDVVFLPTAVRITAVPAALGGQAGPGMTPLTATSQRRVVTVALDAAQQSQVAKGDKVAITLPDGKVTPGMVSAVGKVAASPSSGSGSATITVTISLAHPAQAGTLDQAPVLVSITTASAPDALVVPVTALLALAGGGYAVEVAAAGGAAGGTAGSAHRLVPVALGLFDDADGLVQVTGAGLTAGQRVVVPGT
jgi:peptidoglycan hydrolase-like protein with peptidoglycan-binding domain